MTKNIAKYLLELTEEGRHSKTTIKNYENALQKWSRYTGKPSNYKKWLIGLGLKPTTINQYLIALRLYATWSKTINISRDDIVLSKVYQNNSIKFLNKVEMFAMIANCENIRDRAIITTLFTTGLRVSELVNLLNEDIVQANGEDTYEASITGKGGKTRTVYFTAKTQHVCWQQSNTHNDDRIFPYTARWIQQRVGDIGMRALNKRVTPHMLRHTFATHMLEEGVNIAYIQAFLGHSSLATTQIYLGVRNGKLKLIHKEMFK